MKNQNFEKKTKKHAYRNMVAMQTQISRAMKSHIKLLSVKLQIRSQSLV